MKNKALFQLIKSLKKGEKRYFHLYAQRHVVGEENLYFQLYQAILDQEEYDEAALKEQFPEITHFSFHKNYLYNLLLKSLRDAQLEKNEEIKLRSQLDFVEVLAGRGLNEQALSLLTRLKKKCRKAEQVHLLPVVLHWERKLLKSVNPQNLPAQLNALAQEGEKAEERMATERKLLHLYDRMIHLLRQSQRVEDPEHFAETEEILSHPLVKTASPHMTFLARQAWLFIHAYSFQIKEDFLQAYPWYQQIVELWTRDPKRISAQPDTYSRILASYLNICHLSLRHEDFGPLVKRIRALPGLSARIQAKLFSITYNLELIYYLNFGLFDQAKALVPDLEAGLEKYGDQIDPSQLLTYYYNIALLFFFLEDYRSSLRYINRILTERPTQQQHAFERFARILHMVLHFELKNEDLLIGLIRSFSRQQKANALEKKVIALLRNLERNVDYRVRVSLFKAFDEEMEALFTLHGPRMLGLAELGAWAENKFSRRPIREIISRKTQEWHTLMNQKQKGQGL